VSSAIALTDLLDFYEMRDSPDHSPDRLVVLLDDHRLMMTQTERLERRSLIAFRVASAAYLSDF